MSFSSDVKAEAAGVVPAEKHCRLAELCALVRLYGKIERGKETVLSFSADNDSAYRKCFTLLSKTFNINTENFGSLEINRFLKDISYDDPLKLLDRDCCKRAYLRGAFLASGFIADPNKQYHFEILASDEGEAELLVQLLRVFGIAAHKTIRKSYRVVYIKESEALSDVLNVMGAHKAMMQTANARILKNVRNDVNRRNNCDTANITKAVSAAAKQTEDILYIRQTVGFEALPESLREIAKARLDHPESSLTELGTFLDPPVGKSGVNHRLRKLGEFAESLRVDRK